MHMIDRICAVALCAIAISSTSLCASTTSDPGSIGTGARVISLGNAFTAVSDDPSAIFTNPAGLAQLSSTQLTSMQAQILQEIDYRQLGVIFPFWKGTGGLGIIGSSLGGIGLTGLDANGRPYLVRDVSFYDEVYYLSYGSNYSDMLKPLSLPGDLLLGASLKYFRKGSEEISGFGGEGYDADVGALYKWSPSLSFGLTYKNILPRVGPLGAIDWNGEFDELPSYIRLGTSYYLSLYRLQILFDTDLDPGLGKPTLFHLGSEWSPVTFFSFRAGIDQQLDPAQNGNSYNESSVFSNYTVGCGLKLAGVNLDYAYRAYYNEEANHFFSLSYVGEPSDYEWRNQPAEYREVREVPSQHSSTASVKVVFPRENIITSEPRVSVIGVATNVTSLNINGLTYPVTQSEQVFEQMVELPKPGRKVVDVRAEDPSGNVHILKKRVIRLPELPGIDSTDIQGRLIAMEAGLEPNQPLTRRRFLKGILDLARIQPQRTFDNPFIDVPPLDTVTPYIETALRKKLLVLPEDRLFNPNNAISWGEALAIVNRAEGYPVTEVSPAQDRHWAQPHIDAARKHRIISPTQNVGPDDPISYKDMLSVLKKTAIGRRSLQDAVNWIAGEEPVSYDTGSGIIRLSGKDILNTSRLPAMDMQQVTVNVPEFIVPTKPLYRSTGQQKNVSVQTNRSDRRLVPPLAKPAQPAGQSSRLDKLLQNRFHRPLSKSGEEPTRAIGAVDTSPNRLPGTRSQRSVPLLLQRAYQPPAQSPVYSPQAAHRTPETLQSQPTSPDTPEIAAERLEGQKAVSPEKQVNAPKTEATRAIQAPGSFPVRQTAADRSVRVHSLPRDQLFEPAPNTERFSQPVQKALPAPEPAGASLPLQQAVMPIHEEETITVDSKIEPIPDLPSAPDGITEEIAPVTSETLPTASEVPEPPVQVAPEPVETVPSSSETAAPATVTANKILSPGVPEIPAGLPTEYLTEQLPTSSSIVAGIYLDSDLIAKDIELLEREDLNPKAYTTVIDGVRLYELYLPQVFAGQEAPKNIIKRLRSLGFAAFMHK